jgi:[ribosomal protein S5]-alanine N-acetyltransferase
LKKINISGGQVHLSNFNKEDISSEYIKWLTDPDIVKYSNQRFKEHSYETCLQYFRSFKNTNNLFLKIQDINSQTMIGTMTLYADSFHGTADIGILIGNKAYWGKGVGCDAWIALVSWAESTGEYRKISAGANEHNHGMIKIFQKSGMAFEGMKKKHELINNIPSDVLYYGKFIKNNKYTPEIK